MKPRPRFSLRTLIIAVLAIALCWTLTATWGVNNILDRYIRGRDKQRTGNTLSFVTLTFAGEDEFPIRWTVRARAIAPFFVLTSVRRHDIRSGRNEENEDMRFWLFGYERLINNK